MTQDLEIVSSLEQITRAEIDIQIATAKRYPRCLSKVRENVLTLATMDEETAAACFYSIPRAGKDITGESVRLAEILASSYGHLRAAWRCINVDRNQGTVTCQGVCHDLENNVSSSIEKSRQIQKRRGAEKYDEDMVNLAINACGSIAYRDAVFKVVPKALIKPILSQIKDAARGKGTMEQRVKRVMDRLIEMLAEAGVKQAEATRRILATVECAKVDDINLTKLDTLIGIGTAIKDGEIRIADAFPANVQTKQPDPFAQTETTTTTEEEK